MWYGLFSSEGLCRQMAQDQLDVKYPDLAIACDVIGHTVFSEELLKFIDLISRSKCLRAHKSVACFGKAHKADR